MLSLRLMPHWHNRQMKLLAEVYKQVINGSPAGQSHVNGAERCGAGLAIM